MKDSVKFKVICISIGISLAFAILELLLRFMGFGYNLKFRLSKDRGAEYKIFCIGESVTFGIGASNPILKGYPRQLEDMLNNNFPNLKIQCFFDQAIGVNTSEILRKLPTHIKKYRPNLLIFMVGLNNWWNLDKSNVLLFSKNKHISSFTFKILKFLDKFRVWKLLKLISYSLGPRQEKRGHIPDEFKGRESEFRKTLQKRYYLEIVNQIAYSDLQEMIKICRTNNIKVIICNYPGGSFIAYEAIAKEFDVLFVDNYGFFKRLLNRNIYFSDIAHPNDEGYKLVAQNIYNCILENDLISQ